MLDGVHIEVQTRVAPLAAALIISIFPVRADTLTDLFVAIIGHLRPPDGKLAFPSRLAVVGRPGVTHRPTRLGMVWILVVASGTDREVLNRTTFVVLVAAMAFATSSLSRTILS